MLDWRMFDASQRLLLALRYVARLSAPVNQGVLPRERHASFSLAVKKMRSLAI